MNSTSPRENAVSWARVDAGNLLLGCPGAPGWTMAGAAGSVCRACTHEGSAAKAQAKNPADLMVALRIFKKQARLCY